MTILNELRTLLMNNETEYQNRMNTVLDKLVVRRKCNKMKNHQILKPTTTPIPTTPTTTPILNTLSSCSVFIHAFFKLKIYNVYYFKKKLTICIIYQYQLVRLLYYYINCHI